jgi:hypothetical protein
VRRRVADADGRAAQRAGAPVGREPRALQHADPAERVAAAQLAAGGIVICLQVTLFSRL